MTKDKVKEQEMGARIAEIEKLQEIQVGGVTDINDDVVGAIAGIATREIEGVSSLGTSSIRRSIAERVGGADQRARGVAVEAGKREAIHGYRAEDHLWLQPPGDGGKSAS